ncbi:hypothetical protein FWK35_00033531 [Aphis craccivora]|uniref:Uncharacterized protein n=1 Tax=Aphis craccivora TaxID=307492 RepID=A0A6G0X5J2_APHCR|nr:hypothetical protein FWK35_00033531 [Aphis craccivora]
MMCALYIFLCVSMNNITYRNNASTSNFGDNFR